MEENSWRGLVLAWANRLQITNQPAQQMIDFTDGKFFVAFMIKHLPFWKTKGQTKTETFAELEAGFKEEFTACSVVNMAGAMEGHEDELVKTLTLLMYLGAVKHLSQELSSSLQASPLICLMRYMKCDIFLATGWVHQRSTATVEMRSAGQSVVLV